MKFGQLLAVLCLIFSAPLASAADSPALEPSAPAIEPKIFILSRLPDLHRIHITPLSFCLSRLLVAGHPGPFSVAVDNGWAWFSRGERIPLDNGLYFARYEDIASLTPAVAESSRPGITGLGLKDTIFEFSGEESITISTRLFDHHFGISSWDIQPSGHPSAFLNVIVVDVLDRNGRRVFRSAITISNDSPTIESPFPTLTRDESKTVFLFNAKGYPDNKRENVYSTDITRDHCAERSALKLQYSLTPIPPKTN